MITGWRLTLFNIYILRMHTQNTRTTPGQGGPQSEAGAHSSFSFFAMECQREGISLGLLFPGKTETAPLSGRNVCVRLSDHTAEPLDGVPLSHNRKHA